MDRAEIQKLIETGWEQKYPGESVQVTEVVPKAFGGTLTAIRSKDKNGVENEEIVYILLTRKFEYSTRRKS